MDDFVVLIPLISWAVMGLGVFLTILYCEFIMPRKKKNYSRGK